MERLITFITTLRLSFQLVEHPQFHALIEMARLSPSLPEIPSACMSPLVRGGSTVPLKLHHLI